MPFLGQNLTLLEFFVHKLKYRVKLSEAVWYDNSFEGAKAQVND
jgi:hypothetical protein